MTETHVQLSRYICLYLWNQCHDEQVLSSLERRLVLRVTLPAARFAGPDVAAGGGGGGGGGWTMGELHVHGRVLDTGEEGIQTSKV